MKTQLRGMEFTSSSSSSLSDLGIDDLSLRAEWPEDSEGMLEPACIIFALLEEFVQ